MAVNTSQVVAFCIVKDYHKSALYSYRKAHAKDLRISADTCVRKDYPLGKLVGLFFFKRSEGG